MSNYIPTQATSTDELMHYGVPGMKWGKRKARYAGVSTNGSKRRAADVAKQKMLAAKQNKKAANKAYSRAYDSAYNYSGRHTISQFTNKDRKAESDARWDNAYNKAKDAGKADKQYKAAKKAYKAANKMAKVEAKAVKEKYRQQYMKGESAVGKLYAKVTGADKIYADQMYKANKGTYKK